MSKDWKGTLTKAATPPVTDQEHRRFLLKAARVEGIRTLIFYGVVLCLGYLLYLVFEPFFVPLGWAGIFAVLFFPWYERLESRWGRTSAAAIGTTAVTVMLILPATVLAFLFVREGFQASHQLQNAAANGQFTWINHEWDLWSDRLGYGGFSLSDVFEQGVQRVGAFLTSRLGFIVRNVALIFLEVFITLFALFFFFRDGQLVVAAVRRVMPFDEKTNELILSQSRQLIQASVTTSLIIAAFQGTVDGSTFALVGIHAAVFWGIVMAFTSLLPVIGSWPIYIPACVWLFATGHYIRALILIGVCAGVVAAAENVMRPALISGRARMNELLIFIGVLGGVAAFGMLGIVLGPIVVATGLSIMNVYARRDVAIAVEQAAEHHAEHHAWSSDAPIR